MSHLIFAILQTHQAKSVTKEYDIRNVHFSQGYAGHGRPWEFGTTTGWDKGGSSKQVTANYFWHAAVHAAQKQAERRHKVPREWHPFVQRVQCVQ
jgi:hypothetical protein